MTIDPKQVCILKKLIEKNKKWTKLTLICADIPSIEIGSMGVFLL